jgi:putative component of membrane protein insertase Oxa1/YidC/SpoIIIJ protein YidD
MNKMDFNEHRDRGDVKTSENAFVAASVFRIDGDVFELRVDPALAPSAVRAFLGRTQQDALVDSLPWPATPFWLPMVVRLLRLYRQYRPASVGNRCVFDPSCSRFSELAFRQQGFWKGLSSTVRRLHRCKPGAGGVDFPT